MAVLTDLFTQIANAIREKTGDTANIQASQFATAIANIPSGSTMVHKTLSRSNNTISDSDLIGKTNFLVIAAVQSDSQDLPMLAWGYRLEGESASHRCYILGKSSSTINYATTGTSGTPSFDSATGTITLEVKGSSIKLQTVWEVFAW